MARIDIPPGTHTVDATRPKRMKNGKYWGRFTLRLWDGQAVRIKVTAPTVGEWRVVARARAQERLDTSGAHAKWSKRSMLSDYIREVSIPTMEASSLREGSKVTYRHALTSLASEMRPYRIEHAMKVRTIEQVLQNIEENRGLESARMARVVLSKWVAQELMRDGITESNPLAGFKFQSTTPKPSKKGGVALTEAEYDRALEYLLNLDINTIRGKNKRTAIEMTLLQATTGLRIGEALSLTAEEISIRSGRHAKGETMYITVPASKSKTHRGRTVPVLDHRVQARIKKRIQAGGDSPVFPSPTTGIGQWSKRSAQKAVKRLLLEVARECDIKTLETVASHVWRATLNTIAMHKGVPPEQRSAYFGHSTAVNRKSYTDTTDTSNLLETMKRGQ